MNCGVSKHKHHRTSPKQKRNKTDVHNLENTLWLSRGFWLRFSSALWDLFSENFWTAPQGPHSFVPIFCKIMDIKKSQRVTAFTFLGTVTLQKSNFKIFLEKFLKSPRVPPSIFFHILQPTGDWQSPKGFVLFRPTYSLGGKSWSVLRFFPNFAKTPPYTNSTYSAFLLGQPPLWEEGIISKVKWE